MMVKLKRDFYFRPEGETIEVLYPAKDRAGLTAPLEIPIDDPSQLPCDAMILQGDKWVFARPEAAAKALRTVVLPPIPPQNAAAAGKRAAKQAVALDDL